MTSFAAGSPQDSNIFANPEILPDRGDLDKETFAKALQIHGRLTQYAMSIVLHSQARGNLARRDASVLEFHTQSNAIRLPVSMRNYFLVLALTTRKISSLFPILDHGACVRQPSTSDLLVEPQKYPPASVFPGHSARAVLPPRAELAQLKQRERASKDGGEHQSKSCNGRKPLHRHAEEVSTAGTSSQRPSPREPMSPTSRRQTSPQHRSSDA